MLRLAAYIISIALTLSGEYLSAQSTSWTGTTSTSWTTASNWSNGVPTSAADVVIGDASFTGSNQPSLTGSITIKSLTISGASKAATLTLSSTLTITNDLTIGGTFASTLTATSNKAAITAGGTITTNTNGTLSTSRKTLTVGGNFVMNGTFIAGNNGIVLFNGTSQTISGSSASLTFEKVTINAGTTVTLARDITTSNTFTINGTFDPSTFKVTNSTTRFNSGAYLYVKASVLTGVSGNFSTNPTFSAGSTTEYAGSSNQTVTGTTYSNLIISNSNTSTLGANVTINTGNADVTAGTLDLSTFTFSRSAAGGVFTLDAGTTLRCANTTTPFPANFTTNALDVSSTVEYYAAGAQTISPQTYGILKLSGSGNKSSGATITVLGDLSLSGTVTFIPGAAVTINGTDSIGTGTTFSAGSFSHTLAGDIVNNGTLTGSTSTITMTGNGSVISGAGTYTFNNLTITGSGITSDAATNVTVQGNFATSGSGSFEHLSGGSGTLTMNGTAKTISGTGILLNNFTVSAGSVTTSSSFEVAGSFSATGTFSAGAGTVTLSGTGKTIAGSGAVSFFTLNVPGSISAARNFSIASNLSISGSLTATAGTVTFNGTSALAGTANLFDVTLNGTSLQLGSGSYLGIAGGLTLTAGTFNVTSTTPNTVDFNANGGQSIPAATYHHLTFSTGGTKSAAGIITVNGDMTIGSGAAFSAGSFSHSLSGNFTNNGTFTAGTSTITFSGSLDANVTGAATFNTLTVAKSSGLSSVTLQNSISTSTLNMTTGTLRTGSNTITVTSARNGNGIIIGSITRTHAFTNSTAYLFEGPFNSITFSSGAGNITSITVNTAIGSVSDFSFGSSVNREYNISVTGSSYTAALRLHYEDQELNGNTEPGLELWKYSGSWSTQNKTSNDAADNWVELSGLSDVAGRWSLSEFVKVVRWTGAASSAWENSSNWQVISGSPALPPVSTDVVQMGDSAFTNNPSIASAVTVRSIRFGSAQAVTLSISSGSLTTTGNIDGTWTAGRTHQISVGSAALNVGGDLALGDGTAGHILSLSIGTGTATITGELTQTSSSSLIFSGAGTLNIGGDFNYSSGTFTASTGSVVYNGAAAQIIAPLTYRNLTVNKSGGTATLSSSATVTNDMNVTAGTFAANANIAVSGNLSIASGAAVNNGASTISLGGNWSNSGTFSGGTGTVNLNGGGGQSIASTSFNNLTINKGSGTAAPAADLTINGNLTVTAGTFDLSSFTANRSVLGGILTISSGALLQVGGANNFPANFAANSLAATGTVEYNGTGTQTIAAVTYGNLTLSGGGSNVKSLGANTSVAGTFTINSGSTFSASSFALTLLGNMANGGTFNPSTGTVLLNGSSKSLSGTIDFNNLSVSGSYTSTGDISVSGSFSNTGTLATGSTAVTFAGNMSNSGTLTNSGTVTFSGTGSQSIGMNSGFTSTGTVNFNGTVAPTITGGTSPTLSAVTINNSGGVTATTGWTAGGTFTVANGASFNGGSSTQTFNGTFTNNGAVTSSGILKFSPSSAATLTLPGTSFTSTGTVEFAGAGAITLASGVPTVNTVIVSNSNGAGVSLVSNWTIGGDLTIQSGATVHAGTGLSHTISGNLTSNGTFDGGTSTITFDNSGNKNISANGSATFHHLTVAGSDSVTAVSDIFITGNLTNNGTLVNDGVVITMNGSSNASISGSATAFDMLTVAKSASTVTLGVNISNLSDLVVSSGTLDLASFTAADNSTDGGALTVSDGATMKIGGTSPATFDAATIASTGTLEYTGSGQTVLRKLSNNSLVTHGNLTINASGAVTADSGLSIAGNFVLSAGTFTGGSNTHSIGGNWTMSAGTFTNTGTTIRFNGTGTQTVSSTGSFNSVTVNKAAGLLSLSANMTVSGTLTLTSGNITANSFNVILTGTVSRTSGHIVGNFQKNVSTGAASVTFEIGDAGSYTPVSLTFGNVTVAGTLIAATSSGDHSDVLNSGINPNKSVNRNWTLTNSGITFNNYSATFRFAAADRDAGTATGSFKVSKLTTGTWSVQTTGTTTDTTTQASGITAFGVFQIGESGKVWNGGVDNNWNTAGNWTPTGVPTSIEAVTIGIAASITVNTAAATADLSLGHTSLVLTVPSGNSLTVSGNLTITSGTLNTETSFPSVSGTTAITGGTIGYTGTGAQSVSALNYANLTISGSRGTNSITLPADTFGISGTFTASATFTSGGYITTGNTVEYNGTGSQTVAPFGYNNLLITGTRSDSVKFDSSAAITVAGTLAANASFASGAYGFGGSTIEFNGVGAQTIPSLNYHHLTVSGARSSNTVTLSSADTIGIAGVFTPGATDVSYSQTGTVFEFNGTTAQTIPAFTYNSLVFSGTGTKTISSAITVSNDLVNRSGTTVSVGNISVQINGTLHNAGTIVNDGTVQTGN